MPGATEPASGVLVFEVDATGVGQPDRPGPGCHVRLLGRARGPARLRLADPPGNSSAVVLLRARDQDRLLSFVTAIADSGERASRALVVDDRPRELTAREFEVLRRLADGENTREIAVALSYSERTVKTIVHDLLAKLNCRTRAHAVALAARQGVI